MAKCVNCGNETLATYCPECGQKMSVKKISFKSILDEFLSKWIGFDTQFGRTVIGMIIRPGEVVNSYLQGNRIKYLGPLGFFIVMTTLLLISFDLFGLEVEDFIRENQSNFGGAVGEEDSKFKVELQKKLNQLMAQYFRFISAIIIPFWAISLRFFYRKTSMNYTERLVVAIYFTCGGMWVTILMTGIFAFSGQLYTFASMVFVVGYYSYCLNKIYNEKNYFISLMKCLGAFFTSFILLIIIAILIGLVVGMLMAI